VLDDLFERAERVVNPNALAVAHRCAGLLRAARGDLSAAIKEMDTALAQHSRRPVPLEVGRTLLEKGTLERRAKRKSAAKRTLEEAASMLESLQASWWLARARDELGRIGLRRPATTEGLTPAQRRVAELVASGMSNPEVARTLYMSLRTVETHLTKVYRELGIRSRAQLPEKLATQVAEQNGDEVGSSRGALTHRPAGRQLATILFTDIVGSTARVSELGDRRWRQLLDRHDAIVRRELRRFGGVVVEFVGDGTLSTFDAPARAIDCACALRDAIKPLGMELRCGVHTGEIELRDKQIGGIAVHIGARLAAQAGASEILVSQTVSDLVGGSGIKFESRGTHELKGVPGSWELYAVTRRRRATPSPGRG
jgi:class 3 adenylate cyclase